MAVEHPWLGLVGLLIACFAVAGVGGAVTTPNIAKRSAKNNFVFYGPRGLMV